jgi:hypothetical protein
VSNSPHRSFELITINDLARLAQIAFDDFADLCQRKEYCRRYADRLRLICLCQGTARHYVHHDRGVWDFDLWGFFDEIRGHPFPYRRRGEHDCGPSKFGRDAEDDFEGRKVDVIGRSIGMPSNETPIEAVQHYLCEGRTESATRLAERPVVVVWPGKDFGDALSGEEDVWRIAARPENPHSHAAPFPMQLVERCLECGCPANGVVLDPFLGSGTTALAALRSGRSTIGIDMKAAYCEQSEQRILKELHATEQRAGSQEKMGKRARRVA